MIHEALQTSTGLNMVIFIISLFLVNFCDVEITWIGLWIGLFLVVMIALLGIGYMYRKRKKMKHNKETLKECVLYLFDIFVSSLLFFSIIIFWDKFMAPFSSFGLIYILFCLMVLFATNELSPVKLFIVGLFLTPIAAYLLIKYDENHSLKEAEQYAERAKKEIEQGEYSEAIHSATEGFEICPNTKKARYQLAKCLYWRGIAYSRVDSKEKAVDDFEAVLGIEAGDSFWASVREELNKINDESTASVQESLSEKGWE